MSPGCKKGSILDAFKAVVEERGIAPEKIQGGINVDPLTALTRKGKNCCDKPFENVKVNLEKMAAYKNFKTIEVGGYVFNNSGSSIVQELGFSLAAGVEYLDKLTDAGMKIDEVLRKSVSTSLPVPSISWRSLNCGLPVTCGLTS